MIFSQRQGLPCLLCGTSHMGHVCDGPENLCILSSEYFGKGQTRDTRPTSFRFLWLTICMSQWPPRTDSQRIGPWNCRNSPPVAIPAQPDPRCPFRRTRVPVPAHPARSSRELFSLHTPSLSREASKKQPRRAIKTELLFWFFHFFVMKLEPAKHNTKLLFCFKDGQIPL